MINVTRHRQLKFDPSIRYLDIIFKYYLIYFFKTDGIYFLNTWFKKCIFKLTVPEIPVIRNCSKLCFSIGVKNKNQLYQPTHSLQEHKQAVLFYGETENFINNNNDKANNP